MKEIAKILLDLKAVTLSPNEPYTWASGIKSPIYCDNRLLLSYPKERRVVEDAIVKLIREEYPDAKMLFGTATAGISHAAIAAWQMDLPMGFVRAKSKDHGKKNKIEAKIIKGIKAVVIEDLISTGGSSIEAACALREAGIEVLGIASIFTYSLAQADENLKRENLKNVSLTNFNELSSIALDMGYISDKEHDKINKFIKDPKSMEWMK